MGIDEAGRGPVLGPMVYGCLYCARSYQKTLATLNFADPRELSAKMLKKNKVNLNEISHDSAIGLINRVLHMGVLLTEGNPMKGNNFMSLFQVYLDKVGDADKI
ncbi:Ribonuclease H2 subunit A [Hibiscus syriacus]|uniref:Ribonuclease n=1 Tax=Hibiscus syriacus TaxID=106335 RepID=A0A6A3BZZ5_HIBSY|nr:Ribonuclease H2 subunit A [Hibiscus syriacus]